ncbi:MAG: 4Fe-4S dicluster domain-containing protein [Elusimicrobia bacterium]|nr:4Fe-4S dicluster domain-containing protein [Elusimicrobiota bacterium]
MKLLDRSKSTDFAAALAAAGYRVAAPVSDGGLVRIKEWAPGAEIAASEMPLNSMKDFLFPRTEVIGRWTLEGDGFASQDVRPDAPKTAVLFAKPCDAAALAVLDAVFNWDCKDCFYNAKRDAAAVAVLACGSADEHCFCTSVGGSPGEAHGADLLFRPADGGLRMIVEPLTAKGKALADAAGSALSEGQAQADPIARPAERFDPGKASAWLASNFESPLWKELSLPCLGCGACAYACPACHCFDIQDEGSRSESVRCRNWDSCGFGLFTLHAGGHNPRADQSARWRQRMMHKFSYFPQRFGRLACTGCGRCARLCQAGMDIARACARISPRENA